MSDDTNLRRRAVLQTVGVGVGTAGLATAAAGRGNEYNVGLAPGADASLATDRAESVGTQLDLGAVGSVVTGTFGDEDLRALESDSDVRYVERNGQMQALGALAGDIDPTGEFVPYGIELTDADAAIDEGATGDGITISVVDTGIDPTHEALAGNVVGGYAATECSSFLGGCEEPWDDDNDHGTHVAGTAAAEQNGVGVYGVAPEADLLGVKVLSGLGFGDFDDIAEGIEWSVDNGADVINLSLGGGESDAVADAVEYADNNGVIVVAAAGNDGPCSDCVSEPASLPEAIAVSATDENDDLAGFSSTGPEIELAAPGDDVLSTVPGDDYEEFPGTSMASPHVAGAVASVLGSGIPAGDALSALEDGAEDIGLGDTEQGAGRINVLASIGDGDPDPPGDELDVSTGAATDVGETGATLTGDLADIDGDEADIWFEYGPVGAGFPEMADAGTLDSPGGFSAEIAGLDPGTSYEFRAVASTPEDDDEGAVETFETDEEMEFCFVTTATAGDTATLDSLRRFRDESMATTPVGRGLVGLYYRVSPPIARTMARNPDSTEAAATRGLVDRCANLSDRQAETDSPVGAAMLGCLLTALYLVGLVVGILGHASLQAREALGR